MGKPTTICAIGLIVLVLCAATQADIIAVPLGTAAPPSTLGPYTMTPFPLDDRPLWNDVTSVPSPLGGYVEFSIPLSHQQWGPWYQGYVNTGDMYYTGEFSVTLTMPSLTQAFYLYASPRLTGHTITATTQDGTSVEQGSWVRNIGFGYGFYGTSDSLISTIQIDCEGGLAIGEFGIAAVPVPSGVLLGMIGLSTAGLKLLDGKKAKVGHGQ